MLYSFRTLRPYPISKTRLVPNGIEKPDWAIDVSLLIRTTIALGNFPVTSKDYLPENNATWLHSLVASFHIIVCF